MGMCNRLKLELINKIAKKTHHCDALEWLTYSSLNANDLKIFESKFEGVEQTVLFRAIDTLTPEEALAIPLESVAALVSKGYEMTGKLNVNQCRFIYRILFADQRRNGTPSNENIDGDIFITMNFGNKTEIKHAQSMCCRKLNHPTYGNACAKIKNISTKYLSPMKDALYPTQDEWYENLPLYRSIWHGHLMERDIAKSGLVRGISNDLQEIVCFTSIFEAREECFKANNAANYHKYHVAKVDSGFVLRLIAQYRICGKILFLNDHLSWSVIDGDDCNQFETVKEALVYLGDEDINLVHDAVDPLLLLNAAIKNHIINFCL